MDQERFEKIKQEAKNLYSSIKVVDCPALRYERVSIGNSGFRHILMKRRKSRPLSDQLRRFKLIPFIAPVIQTGLLTRKYSEKDVTFYEITKLYGKRKMKVVIFRIKEGPLHFLSIMN